MKNTLLLLILMFSTTYGFGQANEREILDKFFETYKTNPIEALDYIYGTSKWIDLNGDSVKKLKGQLNQLVDLVGEYHGEEYVTRAQLGDCFVTYVYLAKYDRQPLRFTFEFYRPQEKWMLYSFKYDDGFSADLENVMKYDYLNKNY